MKRIEGWNRKGPRTRWTRAQAVEAMAALDASGKPVREFAESHGLDPQRLHMWRRRLRVAEVPPAPPPAFVPVRVLADAPVPEQGTPSLELVLPGGRSLRIGASFDEGSLRRLLRVLEEEASC